MVAIMAVRAIDAAGGSERRDEAGDYRVFPGGFYRMIGCICRIKLNAFVGLRDLPFHPGRPARDAVTMAAKAKFIFVHDRVNEGTGCRRSLHPGECPGCQRGGSCAAF